MTTSPLRWNVSEETLRNLAKDPKLRSAMLREAKRLGFDLKLGSDVVPRGTQKSPVPRGTESEPDGSTPAK